MDLPAIVVARRENLNITDMIISRFSNGLLIKLVAIVSKGFEDILIGINSLYKR